ncbi:MAG: hypothetical protein ACKOTZ_01630, partial [Chloroflexota bacterium]
STPLAPTSASRIPSATCAAPSGRASRRRSHQSVATGIGRLAPLDALTISLAPLTGFLPIALAGGLVLAALVVRARTPARLIPAVLAGSLVLFVAFYPVMTAMPIDPDLPYFSQALLPTWETGFRFLAGSGGLPAGLLVIGLPLALVFTGAWWLMLRLDDAAGAARHPATTDDADPADSAGA